jgi:hypothetical protein
MAIAGDLYWGKKIDEWKKTVKQCTRCGRRFTEANNIGRWACKQHAFRGILTAEGRWPCCGKIVGPTNNGCVAADHTTFVELPWDETHDIPLPLAVADAIGVGQKLPSVVVSGADPDMAEEYQNAEYRFVRRYDWNNENVKHVNSIDFAVVFPFGGWQY